MKVPTDLSEAKAAELSRRKLPRRGKHRGRLLEVTEGVSKNNNETLRSVVGITDADTEFRLVDVMSATPLGLQKLRHFAVACDAEDEFLAGHFDPQTLVGSEFIVTVEIERRRGFGPRAVISDYAPLPSASGVVTPLRSAG